MDISFLNNDKAGMISDSIACTHVGVRERLHHRLAEYMVKQLCEVGSIDGDGGE